jgi:2-phosphosulfolactate phosphatase
MAVSEAHWFGQAESRLRVDWGGRGAEAAVLRGDIVVVVDVLRFSTTAATAVHHGVHLAPCGWTEVSTQPAPPHGYHLAPCGWTEDTARLAAEHGADAGSTEAERRVFLSPRRYLTAVPGTRVVLASPNGATCARLAEQVPALFVGAFVNARATAAAVWSLLESSDRAVTVLACGERWLTPHTDGGLRFAVEDYLGAGAILSALSAQAEMCQGAVSLSPEARVCRETFRAMQDDLSAILSDCGSGQELAAKGLGDDVRFAAQRDCFPTAVFLRDGWLVPWDIAGVSARDAEDRVQKP